MKPKSPESAAAIEAISMIGLGKLGAPFAAALAHKGYRVIGVDSDPNKIRLINEGKAPIYEPGLQEMISANHKRLRATDDYEFAILNSDVTFIVVPTPSDEQGSFSLQYVLRACEAIGRALNHKPDFHLVVLTSTVLPGATEQEVRPALERYSGKRCEVNFGLCYSPEFIALGSVIRDFLNPDFNLIGEADPHSGELLAALYRRVCENDPPIARMNYFNAELAKIALNSYITMKISFANVLARICERVPGGNVDAVTGALGLDKRIGPKYLKGAIGYGGPCFPRDNKAFTYFAKQVSVPALLAEATDAINRQQVIGLAEVVKRSLPDGGQVAILGLAYKPDTDVVAETQGVEVARSLAEEGIPIMVYDPAAMGNAKAILGKSVTFAPSLESCVTGADVIVIATPWQEFRHIELTWLAGRPRRPVLVDCWRVLDPARFEKVADYLPMGVGPESSRLSAGL